MRKLIAIILVLIGFSAIAQTPPRTGYLVQTAKWKFVNPIWLDSGAYISKIVKTSGQNRYLVYDSLTGKIGYRFVSSATTIDTTSLSNRINLRVKYTDTSSMLSKYLRAADTLKLRQAVNLRVKYTDTSTMLSKYLRSADTLKLSNRINLRVKYTDTSSMLSKYLRSADTLKLRRDVNLKVPYTGATGDVDLDNFSLNAKSIHAKGTAGTGHLGLKHQSSSATASGNETVIYANSTGFLYSKNDVNAIEKIIGSNDTASMLSKYLRSADTLKLSNRINLKQNTLSLTTTGTSGAATLVGATLNVPQYGGVTVTSVTGTAPVVSSGGTTPAISMAAATTFVNGYLTSTDWTTFNNKGSGTVQSVATGLGLSGGTITTNGTLLVDTASASIISRERAAMKFYPINSNPNGYLTTAVTSVAALTLGTTGTDISSTVANGTTTPVITLNVPTASASNRGALSSTDWSTFNGKESVLTFSRGLSRSTNTVRLDTSKSYLFTAGMKLSGLSNTFGQSRVAVIDSVTGAVGYKYISSGGAVTGSSGISVSGSDVLLGQAAAGSGASNFAANRFLYLSTFALQIGGSSGNDLFKFDNVGLNTISSTSLGTTQVDTKGLLLQNTTAAAVNAQQISPSIHWKGQGWKTTGPAASQSVDFRAYVLPFQQPSAFAYWKLQSSTNAGAYSDQMRIGTNGQTDFRFITIGGTALGTGVTGSIALYESGNNNSGTLTASGNKLEIRTAYGTASDGVNFNNYFGRYYMVMRDNGTEATIGINSAGNTPNASSILDISSTLGGVLIPRMTTVQKTAIATPAEGLMVYDLTLHKLYVYDGTVWQAAW